jgi:hypothetical protein
MASEADTNANKDDTLRDAGKDIDAPRLTPQGREADEPAGTDETSPEGGVKRGQPSKAEG